MKKNILFLTIITLLFSACKDEKVEVLKKSARIIKVYKIENQIGNTINRYSIDSGNIVIYVEKTADISNVVPEMVISDGATSSPSPTTPVSFTLEKPYPYTVTGESGLALQWHVTVKEYIPPAILKFTPGVLNQTTIEPGKITVDYLSGVNITALTPLISVSAGSTVSPASGTRRNFTNPQTYTVTHPSGIVSTYVVTFVKH